MRRNISDYAMTLTRCPEHLSDTNFELQPLPDGFKTTFNRNSA